jgi:hypothetical protein
MLAVKGLPARLKRIVIPARFHTDTARGVPAAELSPTINLTALPKHEKNVCI